MSDIGIGLCAPLMVGALLALIAPRLRDLLPPRSAAWLLVSAAVVSTGVWVAGLAMIGSTIVGQIPEVAEAGRWSPHTLAAHAPFDRPVGTACALALVACATALVVASWRRVTGLVGMWRECRDLPTTGDVTVVDDPAPAAFALPGAPGRVVVSSGMLRALARDERQALLAHERAHLRHHHHVFLLVLQICAAVNPMLRPLAKAGAFTLERWADEEAADIVGGRPLVARAIARAALAAKRPPKQTLSATSGPIPQRVTALLAPRRPARRPLVATVAVLMTACCASTALAAQDVDALFDAATSSSRPVAARHSPTAADLPETAYGTPTATWTTSAAVVPDTPIPASAVQYGHARERTSWNCATRAARNAANPSSTASGAAIMPTR
ncbi:Peptidase family M48 [Actinacidiphila yanglinensis]|uniref:Peptidase family M48 n=1 Tax=Actinacidiphila yanglinensis TaxID=310779 RepID=A0A1H6BC16_9ACTN|nr:M56 family metallopeptidase [Actinacidiphila yanglinensis]SEG57777.1 Peptidase family M48 [Actinacidiphila yanglinensis]